MTYITQGYTKLVRAAETALPTPKPGRRLGPEPVSTLRLLHHAQRPTDRSRRIPVS